jgi:hypothetical protein
MAIIVPPPAPPRRATADIHLPTPPPPGPVTAPADPAVPPPPPDPTTLQVDSPLTRLGKGAASLATGIDPDASPVDQQYAAVQQIMAPGVAGLSGPMVSLFARPRGGGKAAREAATSGSLARFEQMFNQLGWSDTLKTRARELLNAYPRVVAHVSEAKVMDRLMRPKAFGYQMPHRTVPGMSEIALGGGRNESRALGQVTEMGELGTLFEELYHAAQEVGLKRAGSAIHKAYQKLLPERAFSIFNPHEQSAVAARGPRGLSAANVHWRDGLATPVPPEAAGRFPAMVEATFGEGVLDTVRQLLRDGMAWHEVADHLVDLAKTRRTQHAILPEGIPSRRSRGAKNWAPRMHMPGTITAPSRARRRGRSPGVEAPGTAPPPQTPQKN